MGLLDMLKEKVSTSRAYGRPSEGSKVGVDLGEDDKFIAETRAAMARAKKDKADDKDDFLESRRAKARRYNEKIGRGIDKVNRGVAKVNRGVDRFNKGVASFEKGRDDFFTGMAQSSQTLDLGIGGKDTFDMSGMIPTMGGGKKSKGGSDDLGFGDFSSMFRRSSGAPRRKRSSGNKGGNGGLVPI